MGNSPSKNASSNTHSAQPGLTVANEEPEPDDRKYSSYHAHTTQRSSTSSARKIQYNKSKLQKKIPSHFNAQNKNFTYDDNSPEDKYDSTAADADRFDLDISLSMAQALTISNKNNIPDHVDSATQAIPVDSSLTTTTTSSSSNTDKLDEVSSSFSDVFTTDSSSSSLSMSPPVANLPPILEESAVKRHSIPKNSGLDVDSVIDRLLQLGPRSNSSSPILHASKQSPRLEDFPISPREVAMICSKVREVFLEQPSLLRLGAPVKIVGDIHGQFNDLLRILKLSGLPPHSNYLFLGDYVDRGKQSLETILLLFCFKIKYPENFFMLRGNHESANITKIYGFYDECKRRLSLKSWKQFVDVFNTLPIAAIISDKIFCIHGGLSPSLHSMEQIEQIHRPTDVPEEGLLADLLWSDPDKSVTEWSENDRGVSYCFGKKVVESFTKKFKFDLIIRGHMVVEDGYEFFARKKLCTVFSAPNYCGEFNNWGAVLSVDQNLLCSFELLKPNKKL